MDRYDFDTQQKDEPVGTFRTIREVFEALGIALILAFLFKAYIIEVYSIPTGSMASTLMGRHKDVNCDVCGYPFQLSASQESNDGQERQRARSELPRVIGGTCPQCQYTMYLGADNFAKQTYLSFGGDRIFVNRSLFTYREPSRWHVTVFRYPASPQVNFIKRLVGLENETVMLRNGQVFVQKKGTDHFEIQRKPLRALLSMVRTVDDNDYVQPAIHELGWKTRWYGDEHWQRSADYKSFTGTGNQEETSWLKFRYITPTTTDWYQLIQGKLPVGETGTPQLITDSLDYNTQITQYPSETRREEYRLETPQSRIMQMLPRNPEGIGLNWVGDLVLRCTLNIEKSDSEIIFNLVKGGINFQCILWFDSGSTFATFSIPAAPDFEPFSVEVPIRPGCNHDVMFCNIDEEMRLIIDGKEIDTKGLGRYDALCAAHDLNGGALSRDRSPTVLDLEPAAIGTQGNASVHVNNLKIMKNMYYISCDSHIDARCDLRDSPFRYFHLGYEEEVRQILSNPAYWTHFGKTRKTKFKLDKDQFLMCGDNSAQSQDSRLWTTEGIPHYVERKYLIGEALYVWWPHGLRFPGTPLALIPNVKKMRWID